MAEDHVMNVFRILGDVSHTASKCILIWAIHVNRSAEGRYSHRWADTTNEADTAASRCVFDYADALRSRICHTISEYLLDLAFRLDIGCLELCPEEFLHPFLLLHHILDDESLCTD